MAMQVLQAMGLPIFTDGKRMPDEFNKWGYLEHVAVKKLKEDKSWIPDADGCAVKIVAPLVLDFPVSQYPSRIVYMYRDFETMVDSQIRMFPAPNIQRDIMVETYEKYFLDMMQWLVSSNIDHLIFMYEVAKSDPMYFVEDLANFLGLGNLNLMKIAETIKTG